MNFEDYLKEAAKAINEELDLILSDFLNETKKINIKLLPFALGLLNSSKGGKRIRGVLCKLGYELANSKFQIPNSKSDILQVGAALEILHTALLIHDDIIDKSKDRRGQPSLYQSLGGGHNGISQAISIGDIGLYLPIKIITETNFLGEYKLTALNLISETMINTGWGQILDVESHFAEASRDKEFINLFKTAKYTVAGPLQLGAILAGADDGLIKSLGKFGENLGIAFQIRDDILDGESEDLDSDKAKALEYASKAKKMIGEITGDHIMKKLLEEMCVFMIERSK